MTQSYTRSIDKRNRHKFKTLRARNVQKEQKSALTPEEYRTKYLVGGNDSLSRLLRMARMVRRAARN